MTSAAGQPVDNVTDVYSSPSNAATIDLAAEITVNPREGEGSSVVDRVEFYKEVGGVAPEHIGNGTLVPGTSPPQYQLSYSADAHGVVGEAKPISPAVSPARRRTPADRSPPIPGRCG